VPGWRATEPSRAGEPRDAPPVRPPQAAAAAAAAAHPPRRGAPSPWPCGAEPGAAKLPGSGAYHVTAPGAGLGLRAAARRDRLRLCLHPAAEGAAATLNPFGPGRAAPSALRPPPAPHTAHARTHARGPRVAREPVSDSREAGGVQPSPRLRVRDPRVRAESSLSPRATFPACKSSCRPTPAPPPSALHSAAGCPALRVPGRTEVPSPRERILAGRGVRRRSPKSWHPRGVRGARVDVSGGGGTLRGPAQPALGRGRHREPGAPQTPRRLGRRPRGRWEGGSWARARQS
jgi:hypothetical protein